jgi:hypothetical protein
MVTGFARPQTEAEMASLALGHLGMSGIADLNDNNIRARACKQFFATVRDAMLREKWWSFAAAWIKPGLELQQAIGPLKNRYVMPENCLRIRYLADDNGGLFYEEDGRWTTEAVQVKDGDPPKEGMVLVTDIASPMVSYTKRIDVVREWDPSFITAFGYELASMVGRRLGRSRTLGDDLHVRAERATDTAATIDSKSKSRKTLTTTPSVIMARTGWRTPGGWWRRWG